jgi:hypothetical protein
MRENRQETFMTPLTTNRRPTPDLTLLGLLEGVVEAEPCNDPLPRMALTDYLNDLAPGPVRSGELPAWLQRSWAESRRAERGAFAGYDVTWAVLKDMEEWLTHRGRDRGLFWYLEGHGATVLGGIQCFTSAPRLPSLEMAAAQAECLAQQARCAGVALPTGQVEAATQRLVLLPTPKQVRLRGRRSR